MKPIYLLMLTLFLFFSSVKAQVVQHRKTRFPVGFYTTGDSDIYGLSVGIGSDTYTDSHYVSVRSNGIRIEPVSQSLLFFTLIFPIDRVRCPETPKDIKEFAKKIPNEVVNGLNISCGTNAFADVNGITFSALVQSLRQTNGLSVSGFSSYAFRNNGIQVAGGFTGATYSNGLLMALFSTEAHGGKGLQLAAFHNDYNSFSGLQIGAFNGAYGKAEKFTGVQIGLFNSTKKLKGIQIGLINRNEKRILPFINWNFKD